MPENARTINYLRGNGVYWLYGTSTRECLKCHFFLGKSVSHRCTVWFLRFVFIRGVGSHECYQLTRQPLPHKIWGLPPRRRSMAPKLLCSTIRNVLKLQVTISSVCPYERLQSVFSLPNFPNQWIINSMLLHYGETEFAAIRIWHYHHYSIVMPWIDARS